MYRIFSLRIPGSVCCPCSLCSGVFPSLPMSDLFRYAANSTSQHSILASGGSLAPMRCSSAAFWPATSPAVRSMIPMDWLFSHCWSLQNSLTSLLTSLCDFLRQRLKRWFVVTSGCDFVVPKLINELRCSLRNPLKFSPFFSEPASSFHG